MKNTIARSVLMIRPVAFWFNPETAVDNCFQNELDLSAIEIQNQALSEFEDFVLKLKHFGIHVLIANDTISPVTPDSIFPNNWITFHRDGRVALFPMKSKIRREERRAEILEFIIEQGYQADVVEDFRDSEQVGSFLEGTGSMVLDREHRVCYACLSERTNPDLLIEFCEVFDYKPVLFLSSAIKDGVSQPVYHTNVMMTVADRYALVCMESIIDAEGKKQLEETLQKSGKEIIEISMDQIFQFSGNAIQLQNKDGVKCLVMSRSAYSALNSEQISRIEKYNSILIGNLETIETIGGGSARCMIAEVFLPEIDQNK